MINRFDFCASINNHNSLIFIVLSYKQNEQIKIKIFNSEISNILNWIVGIFFVCVWFLYI